MKKFEGVQAQILSANEKNQLVSAGAGSGKTTVMIEKISSLILNNEVDVDSLLVVTFTVLAAGEMKERLISKFSDLLNESSDEEKERLLNLIDRLKTASIDTIDGFSSKTIKKYFYELEISPNIEIVSDSTREYLLSCAMKNTLKAFMESDKLNIMIDIFGGNRRNLEPLQDALLSAYNDVINIEDWKGFLRQSLNEYENPIKSENVVNEFVIYKARNLICNIQNACVNFEFKTKDKLIAFIEDLNCLNSNLMLSANYNTLINIIEPKFTSKEKSENVGLGDLSLEIKEFFEFVESVKNNLGELDFAEQNIKILQYFQIFVEILQKFIENYNNLKEKNNLIDFNDLNRLMLKLLDKCEIKQELQNKYKYIFVDEYQDVNPLQDSLISSLVGERTKLFTVGDVKQSIYGFRGSSPEWFLKKYNSMKSGMRDGVAFDMNVNFRSNPKILEFINDIFSKLMTVKTSDIDYKKDALIEPKRTDIEDEKVKILLLTETKNQDIAKGIYSVKEHQNKNAVDSKTNEALQVLKIITDLIGTEFYDANLKRKRTLTYKDISILTRSDKDESSQGLMSVLRAHGVPLNVTNKIRIDECEVVKLIISILKCVSNIADDVDYLASFLALTNLDIDDIVSIRHKDRTFYEDLIENIENEEVKSGFEIIEKIRQNSYINSNDKLIRSILNEQKLKYFVLRKENGERELELLEKFLQSLTQLENDLPLCEFIDIIETSIGKNAQIETMDGDDSVTIQTIHKSKGLEYPVVILYNTSKMFSFIRDHDSVMFNSEIGLGVDCFDNINRTKNFGVVKYAIKLKNSEKEYKEELRLLYVALTRAKNKLYIIGTISEKQKSNQEFKHTNYMNMVLSCFKNRLTNSVNEFDNCTIEFVDDVNLSLDENNQDEFICEQSDVWFKYPHQEKYNIPLKNTVTGLNQDKVEKDKFTRKEWITQKVQYQEEDKKLVGTHYHKALEKLDLQNEYIQNTNFEDVDYKKIKKTHEILQKYVKNALKIKKEVEFMMYVPYNQLVESEITDKVLVQGVVDLLIEHEDGFVVVDYKFSSLPIKVLKQKYNEQLKLYKTAVEKAFNKPVKEVLIVSINNGEIL